MGRSQRSSTAGSEAPNSPHLSDLFAGERDLRHGHGGGGLMSVKRSVRVLGYGLVEDGAKGDPGRSLYRWPLQKSPSPHFARGTEVEGGTGVEAFRRHSFPTWLSGFGLVEVSQLEKGEGV